MHNLEKLFDRGIVEPYKLPLSEENGLCLEYTIIRHREVTRANHGREYLTRLIISYEGKKVLDGIVGFERFMSSLKIFIDRRGYFSEKDIYFEEKKQGRRNSLQLKIDEEKYISITEAMQLSSLIYGALQGVSRKLLYSKYKKSTKNYISTKVDEEQNNVELKNTVVIDFDTEME